jgi:hypothetical protein
MNLRIAEIDWKKVRSLTSLSFTKAARFPPESGCILLVARNDNPTASSLVVAGVLSPREGDLTEQAAGGLTFGSPFLRRALLAVRERGLKGFVTVHTHPRSTRTVSFSTYDDEQDPQLMANLYELEPSGVFGSLVLGKTSGCARIWHRGVPNYLSTLVRVGEQLSFLNLDGISAEEPMGPQAIFDRSSVITGRGALYRLSRCRVAVVGAGGTGSIMVELLMRAGVGEIVIFDFDYADETNLNRVLHLTKQDVQSAANKGECLKRAIGETGMPTKVTVVPGGDIRDPYVACELLGCDMIIGCVDRDWPRLIMSEVAYSYIIPYVDLGSEIGATGGEVQSLDSRVSYSAPGRPCLLCSGFISQERLRLEGYGAAERDRIIAMGYSNDLPLNAPAVMDLNMRAASLGMLVIRHLLQPFLATPLPHSIKETVTCFRTKALHYARRPHCVICGEAGRTGTAGRFALTTRHIIL